MAAPMTDVPGWVSAVIVIGYWVLIGAIILLMVGAFGTGPLPADKPTTRPTSTEAPIHPTTDKTGLCGPGGNRR